MTYIRPTSVVSNMLDICLNGYGAFTTDWTNMPAAETVFLGTGRFYIKADLTNFTQTRLIVWVQTAGSSGSKLRLKYYNAGWQDIAASSGTDVPIDAGAPDLFLSSWVNLVAGAKADVSIGVYGAGGDGVADPAFGVMHAQFK
jgi:hypothetical protein